MLNKVLDDFSAVCVLQIRVCVLTKGTKCYRCLVVRTATATKNHPAKCLEKDFRNSIQTRLESKLWMSMDRNRTGSSLDKQGETRRVDDQSALNLFSRSVRTIPFLGFCSAKCLQAFYELFSTFQQNAWQVSTRNFRVVENRNPILNTMYQTDARVKPGKLYRWLPRSGQKSQRLVKACLFSRSGSSTLPIIGKFPGNQ